MLKERQLTEQSEYEKLFVKIPLSIITDSSVNPMRIALYSYIRLRIGMDNVCFLSINDLLEWLHKRKNRNKGCINEKVIESLKQMKDSGYIDYLDGSFTQKKNNAVMFDYDSKFAVKFLKQDDESFGAVHYDEIFKIMEANKSNIYDLLVFAYLRQKIFYSNEKYPDLAEAWNGCYSMIAKEIGLPARRVSNCVDVLEKLDLIYYERISARKIRNQTMFYVTAQ